MVRRAFALALALFGSGLGAQEVIRVGAVTAIPGIFDPVKPHLEKDRGIRIVCSQDTGVRMFLDVEEGKLDVAVAGISMEGWVETVRSQGWKVRPVHDYKHVRIGTDRISVLINPDVLTEPDVLMMELTREAIQKLFTGEVRNWKELGGPDMPVVVMMSSCFVTTRKVFQEEALDGRPITPGCVRIEGGIEKISPALLATKGAITFGPLALTRDSKIWAPPQAPRTSRPFTMLVSDKLDTRKKRAVDQMVDYLLGPGRKYFVE